MAYRSPGAQLGPASKACAGVGPRPPQYVGLAGAACTIRSHPCALILSPSGWVSAWPLCQVSAPQLAKGSATQTPCGCAPCVPAGPTLPSFVGYDTGPPWHAIRGSAQALPDLSRQLSYPR